MKVVLITGACLVCLMATGGLLAGCDRDATALPERLSGGAVARMAEQELEVENPRLARGTLTCPGLRLRRGVSVRCLRTTELSEGRVVKVPGTVTVRSLSDGGRLHIAMDDRAAEFGLAGERLADDVRARWERRFRDVPAGVTCPYLRGTVGTRVTCRVDAAGARRSVRVEVTAVDPHEYRTSYAVRLPRAS